MDNLNKTLLKTCASCGKQKPLAAFLQLSGAEGATYGNICSACRKTNLEKSAAEKEDAGTRRETGGTRFTSEVRAKTEADKKELFETTEREYHEERDEADLLKADKRQKTEIAEKKDTLRKQTLKSFLDQKPAKVSLEKTFASEQVKEQEVDFTKASGAPVTDTAFGIKQKHGEALKQYSALHGVNTLKKFLSGQSTIIKNAEKSLKGLNKEVLPKENEAPSEYANRTIKRKR